MVAHVTLVTLPSTPGNRLLARVRTSETALFDDQTLRDDRGQVVAYLGNPRRKPWDDLLHARADWFEVGPVSYLKVEVDRDPELWIPGPTSAVYERWASPRLVTPLRITSTMVAMNVRDDSYHRRSREVRHDHRVGRRSWPNTPTRRDVKRWLTAHVRWICFAEVW